MIDVAGAIESGKEESLHKMGIPEKTIKDYKADKETSEWLRKREEEEFKRQEEETTVSPRMKEIIAQE